jgi:hypothetical protein
MFCFWSYASFIFYIAMYFITVVILSLYIIMKFLCDFDMWCIRCYLSTCPIVLTTAMDVNKVEVEVEAKICVVVLFLANKYLNTV